MKNLDPNTVIILIKLFHDTLTEIYAKDIADLVMKNVNDKVRTIQHDQMMEKIEKPKSNLY